MALAIVGDKGIGELTYDERSVTVHWEDPASPSVASMSDAMVKQVSAVPEFGGTDVFWKKLGYSEDERRRIKADVRANAMSAAVNAMFAQPEEAQR